jgi:hypothetical protein
MGHAAAWTLVKPSAGPTGGLEINFRPWRGDSTQPSVLFRTLSLMYPLRVDGSELASSEDDVDRLREI